MNKPKKNREEKAPRKKRIKFDINTAQNAIVEGKLVVPLGTKVIIPRVRAGKWGLSECFLQKIDDDGVIHAWDETLNQWYLFKVTDEIIVKVKEKNDKLRRCYC